MLKNRKFINDSGLFLDMATSSFCLGVLLHVWFAVVGCAVFVCLLRLEVLVVLWFVFVFRKVAFLGDVLFLFIWVWKV